MELERISKIINFKDIENISKTSNLISPFLGTSLALVVLFFEEFEISKKCEISAFCENFKKDNFRYFYWDSQKIYSLSQNLHNIIKSNTVKEININRAKRVLKNINEESFFKNDEFLSFQKLFLFLKNLIHYLENDNSLKKSNNINERKNENMTKTKINNENMTKTKINNEKKNTQILKKEKFERTSKKQKSLLKNTFIERKEVLESKKIENSQLNDYIMKATKLSKAEDIQKLSRNTIILKKIDSEELMSLKNKKKNLSKKIPLKEGSKRKSMTINCLKYKLHKLYKKKSVNLLQNKNNITNHIEENIEKNFNGEIEENFETKSKMSQISKNDKKKKNFNYKNKNQTLNVFDDDILNEKNQNLNQDVNFIKSSDIMLNSEIEDKIKSTYLKNKITKIENKKQNDQSLIQELKKDEQTKYIFKRKIKGEKLPLKKKSVIKKNSRENLENQNNEKNKRIDNNPKLDERLNKKEKNIKNGKVENKAEKKNINIKNVKNENTIEIENENEEKKNNSIHFKNNKVFNESDSETEKINLSKRKSTQKFNLPLVNKKNNSENIIDDMNKSKESEKILKKEKYVNINDFTTNKNVDYSQVAVIYKNNFQQEIPQKLDELKLNTNQLNEPIYLNEEDAKKNEMLNKNKQNQQINFSQQDQKSVDVKDRNDTVIMKKKNDGEIPRRLTVIPTSIDLKISHTIKNPHEKKEIYNNNINYVHNEDFQRKEKNSFLHNKSNEAKLSIKIIKRKTESNENISIKNIQKAYEDIENSKKEFSHSIPSENRLKKTKRNLMLNHYKSDKIKNFHMENISDNTNMLFPNKSFNLGLKLNGSNISQDNETRRKSKKKNLLRTMSLTKNPFFKNSLFLRTTEDPDSLAQNQMSWLYQIKKLKHKSIINDNFITNPFKTGKNKIFLNYVKEKKDSLIDCTPINIVPNERKSNFMQNSRNTKFNLNSEERNSPKNNFFDIKKIFHFNKMRNFQNNKRNNSFIPFRNLNKIKTTNKSFSFIPVRNKSKSIYSNKTNKDTKVDFVKEKKDPKLSEFIKEFEEKNNIADLKEIEIDKKNLNNLNYQRNLLMHNLDKKNAKKIAKDWTIKESGYEDQKQYVK